MAPDPRKTLIPLTAILCSLAYTAAWAADETAEWLVDRAAESGLDFTHFSGMSGEYYLLEITGAGGALVDYDGDGDLDVYLVQGHLLGENKTMEDAVFPPRHPLPLSDRLYRNDFAIDELGETHNAFVDVTEEAGLAATHYGMGVSAADYDNDGWVDLYVTNYGANLMLHNEGDGTFADATSSTRTDDRRWSVPSSFFDYDRDGWLDLYVGNYVLFDFSLHFECPDPLGRPGYCGPLAYASQGDSLFRNRGDGTFENVTTHAGLGSESGNALGSVIADFNQDGWLDLYVANDQVPNHLWMNQGDGTFVNDALIAGCAVNRQGQPEASMGVDAADFDGDGDEDLIMGHLTSETNTLYLNDGQGTFKDSTDLVGLGNPSWNYTTFGTVWVDLDLDGRLDVFVVNGAVLIMTELARLGDPHPLHQPNQVFAQVAAGQFEEITSRAGEDISLSEVSRGAIPGDLDNDGDPDILITNNAGPVRLLINELKSDPDWLGIRIVGSDSGRDLLGTTSGVHLGEGIGQWRRTRTDGSFASSRDPRIVFGLGARSRPAAIEVPFSDRLRRRYNNLPLNSYFTLFH
jgi:hypothetical protein